MRRTRVLGLLSLVSLGVLAVLCCGFFTKLALALTRSQNMELDADGVRSVAICPGFVDTPMAQWSGLAADEMIHPDDCAEVVRMCLRLSPRARIPQVVIERVGATDLIA